MVEEKTSDLFEKVKSNLSVELSDIRFEGSEIVVYTKDKEFFTSDATEIKELVSKLKKRIILRPDPSICIDAEQAEKIIKKLVPEEAGLKDIEFEPEFGTTIIEAEKPGLVIGKGGEILKEIKKQTLWLPVVKRAPVIPSDVVKVLRDLIHKESDFRKDFLDKVGKDIHSGWKPTEWIRMTALGGFREVGRSAILLQTPESKILLDCGIKPGTNEYPYLNVPEFDINKLNAVVISHAHLDHCLHPDSYIQLRSGEIEKISEVKTGGSVLAADFDNSWNIDAISCIQRGSISSPKHLYEIRTKTKRLKVTGNHPFFVLSSGNLEIKNADKLEINDFVPVLKKVDINGTIQTLPKDDNFPSRTDFETCQIIGYIIGDGTKNGRGYRSVVCTDKNIENLKFYKKLIRNKFKISGYIKIKERNRLGVNSVKFKRWLEKVEPSILEKSPTRKIPKVICKTTLEHLSGFLRGLFDAEGSIKDHSIVLSTSSENIAIVTQLLLLRFGIISHLYDHDESKSTFGGKDSFQLAISNPASLRIFEAKINFDDKTKRNKLKSMTKKTGNGMAPKMDMIPLNGNLLINIGEELGVTRTDLRKMGFNYHHYLKEHYPSRNKVKNIVQKLLVISKKKNKKITELELLEKIINSNVMWEPITKINIVETSCKKVYDLTVPGHSNYIANGIIVHNCGMVPYLYKIGYKGPIYMTTPTRDLMVLLCMDYVELTQREGSTPPYSTKEIKEAVKHSICLDYDQVSDITPDMRLTLLNSGHVLGGAIVHVHIGDGMHNVLYTSDYKFDKTALFEPTSNNFQRAETVITESTYGSSEDIMPKRQEAESQLIEVCKRTVERGGIALVPSFAVERSQDVMVILSRSGFTHPIYIDGMVWDATAIHTAYPEYFNRDLQRLILQEGENPFTNKIFKRIGSEEERRKILEAKEPCVIIATSGMLVGGPSVWWLKNLAENKNNSLVFVSYQAEGSLGRRIQKGWKEIPMEQNGKTMCIPINLEIANINGLSGHSDHKQLLNYISRLKQAPERIIVDHGESSKCIDFARTCHNIFRCETLAPKLLETIRLK